MESVEQVGSARARGEESARVFAVVAGFAPLEVQLEFGRGKGVSDSLRPLNEEDSALGSRLLDSEFVKLVRSTRSSPQIDMEQMKSAAFVFLGDGVAGRWDGFGFAFEFKQEGANESCLPDSERSGEVDLHFWLEEGGEHACDEARLSFVLQLEGARLRRSLRCGVHRVGCGGQGLSVWRKRTNCKHTQDTRGCMGFCADMMYSRNPVCGRRKWAAFLYFGFYDSRW